MRLRTFVIGICLSLVGCLTGALYVQLKRVVDLRTKEADAILRESVVEYARARIEDKRESLSTSQEVLLRNNELSKRYAIAVTEGNLRDVKKEVDGLKGRFNVDIADLV